MRGQISHTKAQLVEHSAVKKTKRCPLIFKNCKNIVKQIKLFVNFYKKYVNILSILCQLFVNYISVKLGFDILFGFLLVQLNPTQLAYFYIVYVILYYP